MKKKIVLAAIGLIIALFPFAQTQKTPPSAKNIGNNITASIERGKQVYKANCLSCHQEDGGGVPHLNPPLFENTDVVGDKKKIIGIVLNGMTDRIPLDGEYYSNNMAPHNNLTDVQIADVLTFVRNNFGNKASAVLPNEVKALRSPRKK